jgi:hypothetical protein
MLGNRRFENEATGLCFGGTDELADDPGCTYLQ